LLQSLPEPLHRQTARKKATGILSDPDLNMVVSKQLLPQDAGGASPVPFPAIAANRKIKRIGSGATAARSDADDGNRQGS
jgi:hypothetical protein